MTAESPQEGSDHSRTSLSSGTEDESEVEVNENRLKPAPIAQDPTMETVSQSSSGSSSADDSATLNGPSLSSSIPRNVAKVIKGEIHNVWIVMRGDARYASPLRFSEELPVDEHLVLQSLRELHDTLSEWEQQNENESSLDVGTYLAPFCEAISRSDISAPITGAALSALHKFLLYGFLTTPRAHPEGMTLIAKSLIQCTFEESPEAGKSMGSRLPFGTSAATPNPGSTTTGLTTTTTTWNDDEQVVLKLLNLAALVVRSSIQHTSDAPLLSTDLVVGILETCLHVSHRAKRASSLLKSAAADALGQIILVVFHADNLKMCLEARTTILQQLSSLTNPQHHSDPTCITSLMLLNIAFETMPPGSATLQDVSTLQNDLCKHLLQLSTTQDLVILGLTLRVIFNLFQSIRNHLKVPLEIFLTSVHVRILESPQSSPEQAEVVLESLLEFCQEPALMQDLYLNYDCDVQCTNLFETIASTLGKMAGSETDIVKPLNVLNRLALEGILHIVDSIARRCRTVDMRSRIDVVSSRGRPKIERSPSSFLCSEDCVSETSSRALEGSYDDLSDRWKAEETHKVLQEQKRRKDLLTQAAAEFNRPHPGFVLVLEDLELTSTPATPEEVANFLFTTPHLDKALIGLYLGRGPEADYPFHEKVRKAFVGLYDFRGKWFAEALRKLLSRFRLPGEAQCIDRLMEAFAQELYHQQQDSRNTGPEGELKIEGDGGPNGEAELSHPFKSADAVFTLAFSTILLNTDLHNPTIKDEKRMTLEQFIRNNRGINDGGDFSDLFLTELYEQIKSQEIQVRKELFDLVRRHALEDYDGEIPAKHWNGILSSKTRDVAKACFTPADAARSNNIKAGVHEREMFSSIHKSAIQCISSVFVRSKDDALVLKALKGFKQITQICIYFDLDEALDQVLKILLGHGRDYIMSCIALEYAGHDGEQIMGSSPPSPAGVPSTLIAPFQGGIDTMAEGSATHRGFLSLDCAFSLIRRHPSKIREAWPALIECLCALRDARALPDRVIFLDDFADSRGNLLPLSRFARQSQRRLDGYYRSLSDGDNNQTKQVKGWFFSSMFKKDDRAYDSHSFDGGESSSSDRELSSFSQSLLDITRRARLDEVVLMQPKNLPMAKQTISALLDAIDVYPYFDDPIFEQHAVYSLELALLALIANRDRAEELFPLFLPKFEAVLKTRSENNDEEAEANTTLPTPFLMERVVVTILRSCIHLYDISSMRPELFRSLKLLSALPVALMRQISDRVSCGMAIFLSQKFAVLSSREEWDFMHDMLGRLANFGPGRGFIFDGIANTVESQLTPSSQKGDTRQLLSLEGSIVLAKLLLRFVFGKFENDMSLTVPAMMCLENLYGHIVLLQRTLGQIDNDDDSPLELVPDKELWQNVAVAFYSVCRSKDPDISREGTDCFQRFIASTKVESLPDGKWIDILYLIANKQPLLESHEPRINTCTILGKALLMTLGHLSKSKDNWEDLTDIITQFAWVVSENLREGRKGKTLPLFEHTLHTVTFLSNHMVTSEFSGDSEFGQWASDTLLGELEKVGAGGGSIRNVAATTKSVPSLAAPSRPRSSLGPGEETEQSSNDSDL